MANLVDHVFHHLAGILDQVDDGKQDLSIGLAELLDNGGRLAGSASHDMVSFLHGGRLLSDSCLATGFYRIGSQPPPTNLQLNSGPLRWPFEWTTPLGAHSPVPGQATQDLRVPC